MSLKKLVKKVKKVGKKIENVGSSAFKKVLPTNVYNAASKVVRNPVFQAVAVGVATAGVGSVLTSSANATAKSVGTKMLGNLAGKSVGQIVKQSAVNAVKKEAAKAVISHGVKSIAAVKVEEAAKKDLEKIAENATQASKAIEQLTINAAPIATQIAQNGGDVAAQLVQSETYLKAVTDATGAATREQIKAQLRAQGVPEDQLDIAADAAIAGLAENAVSEKKSEFGAGTFALVAVPLLLALIGG